MISQMVKIVHMTDLKEMEMCDLPDEEFKNHSYKEAWRTSRETIAICSNYIISVIILVRIEGKPKVL